MQIFRMTLSCPHKIFIYRILFLFVLLRMTSWAEPVKAQFIFSGDFSLRGEYYNIRRTFSDSSRSSFYNVLGYGELDLRYNSKRFGAYLSLGASFTKGSNLSSISVPAYFNANVYEAWVRFNFNKNLSLQAGRIQIDYTTNLFFQSRDWNRLVTSHNAIILHYLKPDTSLWADIGFAFNRPGKDYIILSTDPDINNYRYMGWLYAMKKLFDGQLTLTFNDTYDANDNGIDMNTLYLKNTIGGTAWIAWSSWDVNIVGYYQFGHIPDGRRLSANYYAAYVAFHPFEWFNLVPAFEHFGGNDLSDSIGMKTTVHGFSLLYGNTAKNIGAGGLFNGMTRSNEHTGLNNLSFKAIFILSEKISIEATYHWLSLPHPYIRQLVPDTLLVRIVKVPPSFMHSAELNFSWLPIPNLELIFDYALLFPGAGMQNFNGWSFQNGKPVSYAWVSIEWTPVFLIRNRKKPSAFH